MATSRKVHVSPYRPITVKPIQGGKLMSNISSDSVGIANYVNKRDFQRLLEREIRSYGQDYFYPNTSLPLGNQPYPNAPNVDEPITMVHLARMPNGNNAVICATPTTIFRYFSLSDGAYYEGDGTPTEYFDHLDPNGPYYDTNPGAWQIIGSNFQAVAQRWEAIDVNGLTVLNNGVDLPVTYNVSDFEVKPIYELREVGIAAVGTITQSNGYLLCADVQQINSDALTALLSLISSGTITASQTGSFGPTSFTASLTAGAVVSTTPVFSLGSVGQTIQFTAGTSSVITAFTDSTHVTVANTTSTVAGSTFFLINPGTTDYTVVASAPIFDTTMVNQFLIWDNGAVRTIKTFVDSTHIIVDSNFPAVADTFGTTNPNSFGVYSVPGSISRIQYRMINGIAFNARQWGASVPASITAGTVVLNFAYPFVSLEELVGQQITILGAGTAGGNLTATLAYLAPGAMSAIIDTLAVTTVTDGLVQAADATGANIGFIDLEDDGSGIIAMLDLLGNLVVYKDTSIFLGNFTGATGAPFNFTGNTLYKGSKTLYYKNTLVQVTAKGQQFHIFAGRTSFYKYDLVYQQPMEVETLELCKDVFYNNVDIPQPLDPVGVFSFDNPITKEIWFCFPEADGLDKILRFDYFNIQASTSSMQITSGAAVKRPESSLQVGTTEDWVVMGNAVGALSLYGITGIGVAEAANPGPPSLAPSTLVTVTQSGNTLTASAAFFTTDILVCKSIQFPDLSVVNVTGYISPTQITVGGPATTRAATTFSVLSAIWHRLGQPYTSVLESGLDNFGNEFGEKDLESWVIALGSRSPNTTFSFEIRGAINPTTPDNPATVLASYVFTNPKVQSAVGMMFLQNYYQDQITVDGINNPMEIVGRLYNIAGVNSKAFTRR